MSYNKIQGVVFKIKGVPSKMLESHLKVYHIFLGKFVHHNWINNI